MPTPHERYPTLRLFHHPLIQHKLTILRDKTTTHRVFRATVAQMSGLMVYEATRTIPAEEIEIETPLETTRGLRIARPITVAPVLRAGLAMSEGVLEVMPEARIGHIGLFRDERTLEAQTYLTKLPHDVADGPVILLDPMLATGGTAAKALQTLRQAGAEDVRVLCIVAAPEGVERLAEAAPDAPIYAATLDERLDERGFIRPGLGDAGDRLYGT